MKKSNLFFIALLLSLKSFSTIWTVSNDPNRLAQFTNINIANSAAGNGDTLYVYGSSNFYPVATITKKLTVIGAGYNPNSSNTNSTKINGMNLNAGSSGTMLLGVNFIGDILGSNTSQIYNVVIKRCIIPSVYIYNTDSNWVIENCLVNFNIFGIFGSNNIALTVRNNIISGAINGGLGGGNTASINFLIQNNLFLSPYTQSTFYNLRKTTIRNNIFYGLSPNGTGSDSNVFINNICWDINNGLSTLPYGTNVGFGNLVINPLFVGAIDKNLVNFNNNFRLNSNSLARFAGTDSTDIGPTGGASPIYSITGPLTGMPPIPSITQVSLPINATPLGGNIQIFIRGKKNN